MPPLRKCFPMNLKIPFPAANNPMWGHNQVSPSVEEAPVGLLPGEKEAIQCTAESLGDTADTDPRSHGIMGVGLAAAGALFAAVILWKVLIQCWQWANTPFATGELERQFTWGTGLLAASAFMHFHFFWTPSPKYHAIGQVGKTLAAGAIVVILLTALFRGFVG